MPYECSVSDQPAQPTLVIRTRAAVRDLPQVMGSSFRAVAGYLDELGACPAGPSFAAYHNMDMQDLDLEMGFPVSKELPGRGEIQAGELTQGKVASCLHVGPYSDIEPAYQALSVWIQENGYEPTGLALEMYLDDPSVTPARELRTRILFPLK